MSKEPIKRDEEQARAQHEGRTVVEGVTVTESEPEQHEGWKHGLTPQQIARIEAERNPPDPVPTKESAAVKPAPQPEPEPVAKEEAHHDQKRK